MTLERLIGLAAKFFNVPVEAIKSNARGNDAVVCAKHCFRTLATEDYGITAADIINETGVARDNISHSRKVILDLEQFAKEYDEFKMFVLLNGANGTQIAVDESGIERITNEAFDSRFYKHPTKINTRTGNSFFPAFHHLTHLGSPEPIGLTKWRQDKGHFADYIMERSQEIGSYVHDCIDRMIKNGAVVHHEDIHVAFKEPKEAQRVKDCLLSFINFIRDEEPIVLASEQMMCGDDFGFTLDSKMKLKSDKYKSIFVVDWKTSKVANEDHKMQVEAMRRVSGCDRAAVVVLGNTTKKKYTLTAVKPSEQDHLWNLFQAVKDTAYVKMLKSGNIKPREDNMPSEFSLKDLNIKFKL